MSQKRKVYVVGVGMTKVSNCTQYFISVYECSLLSLQFEKPGRREDFDYPDMAKEAGLRLCGIISYYVS